MIKINNETYRIKSKDNYSVEGFRYLYVIVYSKIDNFRKHDYEIVNIVLIDEDDNEDSFEGVLSCPHECLDHETVMFRVKGLR